jgi:hypothetical protein
MCSLPDRSVGVGSALFYGYGRLGWSQTPRVGGSNDGQGVRAGWQVTIIALTLADLGCLHAVDRQAEEQICPKICDSINDQMAPIFAALRTGATWQRSGGARLICFAPNQD